MNKHNDNTNSDPIGTDALKRIQSLPRNYLDLYSLYSIAESAFVEYQKLSLQAIESEDSEARSWLIIRKFQNRDIMTVFSQLFLEAVIYDYGASNTSDSYMKKYVDKLDFLAKWVLIPQIVTGRAFPTDSQAFELLSNLKKARNDLVHFKTSNSSKDKNLLEEANDFIDGRMGVRECFDCMSEALKELHKLGADKWLLFEWAFIKRLMEKSHNDILDMVTDRIRDALGISLTENLEEQ